MKDTDAIYQPVAVGLSQEVPHVSQVKLHILLAFIVLEEV